MQKLVNAFNPATIEGLMCRNLISVDWLGNLFDCDFNQLLDLRVESKQTVFNFDFEVLKNRPHKVTFLWRFHLVHHSDLDLDSTIAFRFHFGEITISVAWRIIQIMLIGASPEAVKIWQILLFPAVLFHHSNIKLPADFEEKLTLLFITPRLHGIHYSAVQTETDSNWSSIFSVWDRFHQTLNTDVKQDEITIGVPAFQNPTDIELTKILGLPFQTQNQNGNYQTERIIPDEVRTTRGKSLKNAESAFSNSVCGIFTITIITGFSCSGKFFINAKSANNA